MNTWLLAIFLNVSGQQISLSNVLTIFPKLGLCARSRCQQSSISWWSASGQSMGAGNLNNIDGNDFLWIEQTKGKYFLTLWVLPPSSHFFYIKITYFPLQLSEKKPHFFAFRTNIPKFSGKQILMRGRGKWIFF